MLQVETVLLRYYLWVAAGLAYAETLQVGGML